MTDQLQDLVKIPGTDIELDLSKPEDAAVALVLTRTWYTELSSVQRAARDTLRAEADRRGQRTFEMGGHKIVVDNPTWDRTYDVAKLHEALTEAGLNPARLSELITWEPKVDGKIIRELERHPQFKVAIDAAIQQVTEKTRRVVVD
jgi:hypothetical protein